MKGTHPRVVSQLLIANSIRSYSKEYNKSLVFQRDTRVTWWHLIRTQWQTRMVPVTPFYAPPIAAILWCQFLCARSIKWSPVSGVPLRFPASLSLMDPVLRFLRPHGPSCTVIALDVYPKRYWWPLIQSCASKSCRLAVKGVVWGTSVTFQTRLDSPSWDPWGSLSFWCTILGYILQLTLNSNYKRICNCFINFILFRGKCTFC